DPTRTTKGCATLDRPAHTSLCCDHHFAIHKRFPPDVSRYTSCFPSCCPTALFIPAKSNACRGKKQYEMGRLASLAFQFVTYLRLAHRLSLETLIEAA